MDISEDGFVVVPATERESRRIWEIRYHPAVNAAAMWQTPVSFADHDRWFKGQYASGRRNYCFVLKHDTVVIGYCRFDETAPGQYAVSIALHPEYHGRGLGAHLLKESMARMGNGCRYIATIKPENAPSHRLFQSMGFVITHRTDRALIFER